MDAVFKIRRAYQKILKLDSDLFYFSVDFEIKELEINNAFDKLSFQAQISQEKKLLFEIDLFMYLNDELDPRTVNIYDHQKPGYLEVEVEINE